MTTVLHELVSLTDIYTYFLNLLNFTFLASPQEGLKYEKVNDDRRQVILKARRATNIQ